jgi:hypothetical protein
MSQYSYALVVDIWVGDNQGFKDQEVGFYRPSPKKQGGRVLLGAVEPLAPHTSLVPTRRRPDVLSYCKGY